jgi:hypothetical protein
MYNSYCLLSFLFIGASLYTMFTCETCTPFIEYKKSLSPKQMQMYQNVSRERVNLASQGLILGTILSIFYLYIFKNTFDIFTNSCAFTGIVLLTQYLYYMLMPKMSMLPQLNTQEQIEGWFSVYKFMQYRYHFGMLLGTIGYFILAYVLTCY